MSGNHDIGSAIQSGAIEAGIDVQFKALTDRIAKTADSDMKEFLSGILKATELTLTDLKSMRERLDKTQANAEIVTAAAQKDRAEATAISFKTDIQAQAHAAGAVDATDVLPFIALSEVQVGEDGKSNVGQLIANLKKLKPHLFNRVNTSAPYPAPRPDNSAPRSALEMTLSEYRAAKSRVTRR